MLVVVLTTVWFVDTTDDLTPVALPTAAGTPLTTVTPSAKPTGPPPPQGRYTPAFLISFTGDKMPTMPAPQWGQDFARHGSVGGAGQWMTVHPKFDGTTDWGNGVEFGGVSTRAGYTGPAKLRAAASYHGEQLLARSYDGAKTVPFAIKHRTLTVGGHQAHEITAKVPVKQPKLTETHSIIAITVIDRGDGSAVVAIGDFAGSTPQWLSTWRQQVAKIQITR